MMRVLVDMNTSDNITKVAAINIGYATYSEHIDIEHEDGNIEEDVKGLLMYDFEGEELCIRDMDEKVANDVVKQLFRTGMCDLCGNGICDYT